MPSSAFLSALAFFSFVLLVVTAGSAFLAFFCSNFACFSAFFRSRSTARAVSYLGRVSLQRRMYTYALSRSSPLVFLQLLQLVQPC